MAVKMYTHTVIRDRLEVTFAETSKLYRILSHPKANHDFRPPVKEELRPRDVNRTSDPSG